MDLKEVQRHNLADLGQLAASPAFYADHARYGVSSVMKSVVSRWGESVSIC